MRLSTHPVLLFTFVLGGLLLSAAYPGAQAPSEWGFYAHRRINRMAVFTLPPEMIVFYKHHLEYITEHAVDPDKRRYATRHEAVRHYIDIDHWGQPPFPDLPRTWLEVLMKYTRLSVVHTQGDTSTLRFDTLQMDPSYFDFSDLARSDTLQVSRKNYRTFFIRHVLPQYYDLQWTIDCDSLSSLVDQQLDCANAFARDHFSAHGILPYHLEKMQYDLTRAFEQKDQSRILRLSADMGHYVGDAHVPLHTTTNYNGQLTGQEGIHAFWESRIPELFADEEFDYFVGPAGYWQQPRQEFWEIVLSSHQLVDSVLLIESRLSRAFPRDQQFCFDQRLDLTVRTQCRDYARAYHEAMDGMVEDRMRQAILALGSAWYTAWVNAGQPDLRRLLNIPQPPAEPTTPTKTPVRTRQHEGGG